MDKLLFKKTTSKTDPDQVGEEHEYILAETIINDRSFLAYLEGEYEYNYNLAVCLYNQLIGKPETDEPDGWPGKNNASLLTCGVCFHQRCNPFTFSFEETDTEVIWSGFNNGIPVFRFEKEHYKTALAQLKEIADEGPRVIRN